MNLNKNLHSITLTSAIAILFLIFILSTAISATAQSSSLTITETQITNSGRGAQPDIYGDKIVWTDGRNYDGNYNIYMYDLSTSEETQITSSIMATTPKIYNDRIVWTDSSYDGTYIYMYDLTTSKKTRITTVSGSVCHPAIHGDRIVWMSDTDSDGKYDIYLYDLSTSKETQITTSELAQNPKIYDDRIVWADTRSGNSQIYMYDISMAKETQITKNSWNHYTPSIYGNKIVYETKIYETENICVYDLLTSTEQTISSGSIAVGYPEIYDNRIVWADVRKDSSYKIKYDIYLHDLSTATTNKITDVDASESANTPKIYGNRIVWENIFDGNSNVYICTISDGSELLIHPVANFTTNVTQGFAPLSVQFRDVSENSTSRNWDFENDGNIDSTEETPVHVYTNFGTYTVNLTASNENGTDSKTATINVIIPPPIINSIAVPFDPVPVNTSIIASVNVMYLGSLNSLSAEWDWGDERTSKYQVSSPKFEASHVYNSPGIYTIKLTVTDTDGRSVTKEAPNYVVVYDPQGGFVTGGGWINSPAGAYVPDKTLAGKATFGFVSKYEKGATVPTGKTEFQFNIGNLNFRSENYDWLVVADSKAKYKGTGTINGEGNYGFMVSAFDGAVDKFRITIWEKEIGNTIYDNEMGTPEDSEPSTAISGGSIIVHKKK